MGGWALLLAVGFGLMFVGLVTHWSLIAAGALLPFIPVMVTLWKRRRDSSRSA
jgi:hypothetical protein